MPSWHACYTRARSEKKVAERLIQKGFTIYLPLLPRVRQWKDRRKTVPWPVFPSYVFVRLEGCDLPALVRTPGVVTILAERGQPATIPDDELENVRRFVDAVACSGQAPDSVTIQEFQEGQAVRVVRGPFAGVAGRVREVRGRKRLLVGLTGIGQALEVDLDASALETAGSAGPL
jgi:transcriptional antiterminator RfaH